MKEIVAGRHVLPTAQISGIVQCCVDIQKKLENIKNNLLKIQRHTCDPQAVRPHLKKYFVSLNDLCFASNRKATKIFSLEGEKIALSRPHTTSGAVEAWLSELETTMLRRPRNATEGQEDTRVGHEPQTADTPRSWTDRMDSTDRTDKADDVFISTPDLSLDKLVLTSAKITLEWEETIADNSRFRCESREGHFTPTELSSHPNQHRIFADMFRMGHLHKKGFHVHSERGLTFKSHTSGTRIRANDLSLTTDVFIINSASIDIGSVTLSDIEFTGTPTTAFISLPSTSPSLRLSVGSISLDSSNPLPLSSPPLTPQPAMSTLHSPRSSSPTRQSMSRR
ncbi:hypothetical protein BLNAU_22401 [Blattamonas nauphoetae]|uniref:Dynein heavy chain linker domain-containing protein n=1 Tax=Blattamonas nauphoetae TaxID=2049346 RepID=A0ABQ9WT54_9EUKA|nr:hypothetical protein BLNAU_22401 [Blattamonas nauphoetae]